MKNWIILLCLVTANLLSAHTYAREVSLNTELKNYGGNGAYLAVYLTNSDGRYQKTLWVAGQKAKYYKHLSGWAQGSRLRSSEYDAVSGASVLTGKALMITIDLADAYIDSGYQIRVDSAVEDKRDSRNDVVVSLTTEGAGKPVSGRGYVKTFTYSF